MEQELRASLRVAQQGISLNWSCNMEGFGGIEQFCWEVLCFSLGVASFFLTGSIIPSLQSLGTQRRCQEMAHSGFPKEEDAVFLILSLSWSSHPVLGLGFPC